jgi:diguanylate cyclase (GGDEF)-like protein
VELDDRTATGPLDGPRFRLDPEDIGADLTSGWRGAVLRMGHRRSVGAITAVSVAASVTVTLASGLVARSQRAKLTDVGVAVAVPLMVAPLASHHLMGILFQLAETRAKLHQAAVTDALTGLANRRFFMDRLRIEVERAGREGRPLAVAMIDLDHFKWINDTFGHGVGDVVLERAAGRLQAAVRPYDLVARYGGEEFVALLPGAGPAEAKAVAERMRAAVEGMPTEWHRGHETGSRPVTVSIGVACLAGDDDGGSRLLQRADAALYAAKRNGRNRSVVDGDCIEPAQMATPRR